MGPDVELSPWDKGHVLNTRVFWGAWMGRHPSIRTSLRLPPSLSGAPAALALPKGLPRELVTFPLPLFSSLCKDPLRVTVNIPDIIANILTSLLCPHTFPDEHR